MDYSDFDHDSSKFLKESISSSPLRQLTHLGLLGIKNYGPSSVNTINNKNTSVCNCFVTSKLNNNYLQLLAKLRLK